MNVNAKLSVQEEELYRAVAEGEFHCPHRCIKAEEEAIELDMEAWLPEIGLDPDNCSPKKSVSPRVASSALSDLVPSLKWRKLGRAERLRKYHEAGSELLRIERMLSYKVNIAPELLNERPTISKWYKRRNKKTGKVQGSECVQNIHSDH